MDCQSHLRALMTPSGPRSSTAFRTLQGPNFRTTPGHSRRRLWDGKIFFNTLDGNTIAVDAKTGNEVWKTKLGHINLGESMTMAPLVVKSKVLVGNSGGEFGVRGWITALDAGTGKIAWKAFSTGPDKDVLIGTEFHPFYDSDKGNDLGVKTWPPQAWMTGGGTVWGWIAYDPI